MHRALRISATIALIAALASTTSIADAQAPSLLVLEPIGAPDPGIAQALSAALSETGTSLGYHVVVPAAGSVLGTLDPSSGESLVSIVQRTGLHRAVAVWIAPVRGGYDVRVGIASSDGSAQSLSSRADASSLLDVVRTSFASLLPAPFIAASGTWGSDVDDRVVPRRSRGLQTAMIGAGAGALGGGWLLNVLGGLFAGYHTCIIGCGSTFDPAFDGFREMALIPIVGPWIQLSMIRGANDLWPEWLVLDGLIQAAGTVMLFVAIGLASWDDEPPPIAVIPMLGPSTAGAALLGSF